MITSQTIAFVIKARFKLSELPFDVSMADAGLSHSDLLTVQQLFSRKFYKTVSRVEFRDTVYTLTEKINGKL